MKKIITAMGSQKLNEALKSEEDFEVIYKDIQYQEGILEILEKDFSIDFLILSEILPGEYKIKELIDKIKSVNNNLKIILFLENKNQELENYLYAKGINLIFYNNQIDIKEIVEIIRTNQKNPNSEIQREIDELKKLLLEKEEAKKSKSIFNKIKENNHIKNKQENKSTVICISGTSGIGKSIFSITLARSFINYKNKILIIDFDILNKSLHTILGVKNYSEKIKNKIQNNLLNQIQIEELAIKINSKIDLISGINLLFDSENKISSEKLNNILNTLKQKYDLIIIDTSSECFYDYTRELMQLCNLNIFITGANILEIKKARNLLNIYINQWKIPQKKFSILFNKYDKKSIAISILKKVFSDFYILGKLPIDPNYNLIINRALNNKLDNYMQEEYKQIQQKLFNKIA